RPRTGAGCPSGCSAVHSHCRPVVDLRSRVFPFPRGPAVRVAHFDCFSGISGDMVLGAVIDAGVPANTIRTALDSLGLPIKLEIERVKRCGFAATKATVEAADQEDYRFLPDVEAILAKGALSPKQRELATTIFRKVAVAEATVHGMPLERVHFH